MSDIQLRIGSERAGSDLIAIGAGAVSRAGLSDEVGWIHADGSVKG